MNQSPIEWTEVTWNPLTGCTQITPGCAHCYAKAFAERFRGVPGHPYQQGFDLTLRPERLNQPLLWKSPKTVFVNSMSDLFHEEVPFEYIERVFTAMRTAHWHTFQVLTKRAARLASVACDLDWPSNVWMGVSVENQRWTERIDSLRQVPAAIRFLSCEPLLGPLIIDLRGMHWVIAGGESGAGARPMDPTWVRGLRDQAVAQGVPFFFKQWGAFNDVGKRVGKKVAGRTLDGTLWNGLPARRKPTEQMVGDSHSRASRPLVAHGKAQQVQRVVDAVS